MPTAHERQSLPSFTTLGTLRDHSITTLVTLFAQEGKYLELSERHSRGGIAIELAPCTQNLDTSGGQYLSNARGHDQGLVPLSLHFLGGELERARRS